MIFDKPFNLYGAGGTRGLRLYKRSIILDLAEQVDPPETVTFENIQPSDELARLLSPEYSVVRIPWNDGGAPWHLRRNFWESLADWLKEQNRSVIVCCMGGHGRTGTALTILASLLRPDLLDFWKCPVRWLRKIYCTEAVETHEQMNYIESITNRRVEELPSWWYGRQTVQYPLATIGEQKAIIYDHSTNEWSDYGYNAYPKTHAEICNDCDKDTHECYTCSVWRQATMGEQPETDTDGRIEACESCYKMQLEEVREGKITMVDCTSCNLWEDEEREKLFTDKGE